MQCRMQLRAIAMELFEWWEAWIRAEVIAKLKFKDMDVALLKLVHEGFTAEEIARMLDITRANIHVKLRRLNYKLEVHSKKHAAEKAIQLGILNV